MRAHGWQNIENRLEYTQRVRIRIIVFREHITGGLAGEVGYEGGGGFGEGKGM